MSEPRISITAALGDAWERMKAILFRPFDPAKWLTIGFTAWLAGLTGGGGNASWNLGGDFDPGDSGSAGRAFETETWAQWGRWLLDHPLWLAVGVFGCTALLALFLLMFWLSSRGKFMFLDNVVHDRGEVVRPWKRYRRLANSHLFFQLAFFAVLMVVALGAVLTTLALVTRRWDVGLDAPLSCVLWLAAIPLFLAVIATIAYIQYFLDGFVVPLMYRYDLRVMDAWNRFGGLFRQHSWSLLLSGLFVLALALAVGMGLLVAGLMTCCIGLLLLMIPYIGTVLILPLLVTYRAFTVALLEQIEPGYFPQREEASRVPQPGQGA